MPVVNYMSVMPDVILAINLVMFNGNPLMDAAFYIRWRRLD